MEAIKVSHIRIVFNDGKVAMHDNVILVLKENCIAIAKDKNSTVIIPYSNVMSIYCSGNE